MMLHAERIVTKVKFKVYKAECSIPGTYTSGLSMMSEPVHDPYFAPYQRQNNHADFLHFRDSPGEAVGGGTRCWIESVITMGNPTGRDEVFIGIRCQDGSQYT